MLWFSFPSRKSRTFFYLPIPHPPPWKEKKKEKKEGRRKKKPLDWSIECIKVWMCYGWSMTTWDWPAWATSCCRIGHLLSQHQCQKRERFSCGSLLHCLLLTVWCLCQPSDISAMALMKKRGVFLFMQSIFCLFDFFWERSV